MKPEAMAPPPPVEVRGLVKRYGELTAVAGVDLTVNVGDVYGYLGPNGAGKTTSLRMMLGLIRPTEGSVSLFGRDPQLSVHALKDVAGFVEAPTFYPYLSGRRNREAIVRSGSIVYEGEIADLKRGAGTTYRLATTDDERALAVCHAQRGVSDVRRKRERITFSADEASVAELSQGLIEAGALIRELAPQTVTLEDLFFSLTEGAQDGAAAAGVPVAAGEASA